MTKPTRTCTHSKKGLLEGICIECDTWEEISKDLKPDYITDSLGNKSKHKGLTISNNTFLKYKKKITDRVKNDKS